MKRPIIPLLVALLAVLGIGVTVMAQEGPDSNQVSYWCDIGIKLEPVATPFVVPPPPGGYTYTQLILKAGSGPGENEAFANPVVGQSYTRTDGKAISHVILCKSLTTDSTTTTSTTLPPPPPPPSSVCVDCVPTQNSFPPGSTTTLPSETPPITGPAIVTTTTSPPVRQPGSTTVPPVTSPTSGTLPKTL